MGINPELFESIKNLVERDTRMNLKEGFKFAYLMLLRSIRDMDYPLVSSCCEGNLACAFQQGLDHVKDRKLSFSIANEHHYTWSMQVVDF